MLDVRQWTSTSKLSLNPGKTEFIVIGSKRQRDKLKACLPLDILGSPPCPAESVNSWCGLNLIFPTPNMF